VLERRLDQLNKSGQVIVTHALAFNNLPGQGNCNWDEANLLRGKTAE